MNDNADRELATRLATMSQAVGVYQTLLRRSLEHFFPDASVEVAGDRSFIGVLDPTAGSRPNYQLFDDPDGLGMGVEWFRTPYLIQPGSPSPFLASERLLITTIARVLDLRFRAFFDSRAVQREYLFHSQVEDYVVSEMLNSPEPGRVLAALETLRVAALSTYENRRLSTGVLLLGTEYDPATPARRNLPGAPRYNSRLSAIKSVHRICDGLQTLFVVDLHGDLAWPIDVRRWADRVQSACELPAPCPRDYEHHARATISGGHIVLVLSPAQEIKIFSGGTQTFLFSDARWRLLDVPSKFADWRRAVGDAASGDLARRVFQSALNLAEERKGALFVVLRSASESLPLLVAPGDRILDEGVTDDPDDPDNLSPRLAKRSLHHLVRGQSLRDLDDTVLEALAGVDGAVVLDLQGRILSFGAILRVAPETILAPRAVEGARTTAALAASFHGPVLKVSEDGFLTMFLGGRRVWEI